MTTILLTCVGEEGREAVSTGVQHPTDGRSVLRYWIGRFDICFGLGFHGYTIHVQKRSLFSCT